MDQTSPPAKSTENKEKSMLSRKDHRQKRLSEALRDNLKKRKVQTKMRRAAAGPEVQE